MAIDALRLLTESAARIWPRLAPYGKLEKLAGCECFDCWAELPSDGALQAQLPFVRRDFRRMRELLTEIETLVHSRERALQALREQVDNAANLPSTPNVLAASVPTPSDLRAPSASEAVASKKAS